MPTYDAASFPTDAIFANGAVRGGPVHSTLITRTANGAEQRNGRSGRHARRRFLIDTGTITDAVRVAVLSFFDDRRGQSDSFRFTDPFDFTATDEPIVSGQLIKRYTVAGYSYDRPITKPKSVTFTGGGTLNYETGVVSGGAGGTWSGTFEIEARFNTDHYIERNYFVNHHEVKIEIVETFDADIPAVSIPELPPFINYEFPLPIEIGRERYQDYSTYIYDSGTYAEDRVAQYGGPFVGFSGNCMMRDRAALETLLSTFLIVRGRRSAFLREGFNVRFGDDQLSLSYSGNESFECPITVVGVV